jgi:hypothetical protein
LHSSPLYKDEAFCRILVKSRLFKGRERLKQALLKIKEGRRKNGGKNF